FLRGAWRIFRRDEEMAEADNFVVERRFFRVSLIYLFAHFLAILAEAGLRLYGLGGWG
ncbi:MAG: protoheme IX farnesyltransferase, partial [Pseudomonadota bacterium]